MLIETDFQRGRFVAVPDHVVEMVGKTRKVKVRGREVVVTFSPEAAFVLVWLARRPTGAQVYVASIQRALGLGKDKWQRISRELRAFGALAVDAIVCKETGRRYGEGMVVQWPEPCELASAGQRADARKPGFPAACGSARKPGFPAAGKPGGEKPGNPAPSSKPLEARQAARPSQGVRAACRAAPGPESDATVLEGAEVVAASELAPVAAVATAGEAAPGAGAAPGEPAWAPAVRAGLPVIWCGRRLDPASANDDERRQYAALRLRLRKRDVEARR